MPASVVVGTQWGDEAKAKVVDFLAERADVVVRYQGGANAGHTVVVNGEEFIFHLIPSGALHDGKVCVLGSGMVVDLPLLCQEMELLSQKGIDINQSLILCEKLQVVMPYHKALDVCREKRPGKPIGTTCLGIGPAYSDKYSRVGVRLSNFFQPSALLEKVKRALEEKNLLLRNLYDHPPYNHEAVVEELLPYFEKIKALVADSSMAINKFLDEGKKVLFEGAQGTMLDIDHGTYPYVTSSSPSAGGACASLGISPRRVNKVIGVLKAYTTRVGGGPLPTELKDSMGKYLRDEGYEYGRTTGRPRRCGWLDAVAARYASTINGLTHLAVTKLDVLDQVNPIKICIAYDYQGQRLEEFPAEVDILEQCKPIYEDFPGWLRPISHITRYSELPKESKRYLERLSEVTHCPVSMVGVGPQRHQIIIRGKPPL